MTSVESPDTEQTQVTTFEASVKEALRKRKAERMRLGSQVGAITHVPSTKNDDDEGVRVGLAPLTEREYDLCLREVAALNLPETIAGARTMDRHERKAVLRRALRDPNNWNKMIFESVSDMDELIQPEDVNFLWDEYMVMSQEFSPSVANLTEEEMNFLGRLFGDFQWKDLSGRQLYALNRFLSTLSQTQLTDSLPGSLLTRL